MNKDHQIETETHKIEHYEDEIELIDILSVIWKWKYLILVGTVVCGLIAAIISFNMSKVYSIDMVLRPGILNVGEQGKNTYIDSAQNIKALIDSGTFNNNILNHLNEIKMENIPKKLEFKVNILKDSDTIKVIYETNDVKQGLVILNHLKKILLKTYSESVQYFKNEYEMKLEILKSELDYIKVTIQSYKRNVKNIEKRIDELTPEIELIKNNTANLISERDRLLSKKPKENNILSALLYSNTIQQNLELSNNYQNEVNDYKIKKEEELQKIEESENKIAKKLNEIKNLQFKKDNIQNIQTLQPATNSRYPVKPRILRNVMLALVAGFFLMMFLALFLEYISKYKNKGD